jgi:hypothetical protein
VHTARDLLTGRRVFAFLGPGGRPRKRTIRTSFVAHEAPRPIKRACDRCRLMTRTGNCGEQPVLDFADLRAGRREPQEGDAGKRHQVETERIRLRRCASDSSDRKLSLDSAMRNIVMAQAAARRIRSPRPPLTVGFARTERSATVYQWSQRLGRLVSLLRRAAAPRDQSGGGRGQWIRASVATLMRSWCQGEDLCGASPAKGLARSGVEFGLENRPTERGLWRGPADRAPGPPRRRREDRSRLAEAQAGMEG